MTQAELSNELRALLRLLREHDFLRYSATGRREYEEKLRTVTGLFTELVARALARPLPNPYPAASLEGLKAEGPEAAVRAAQRLAAKLRGADGGAQGAEAWRKAAEDLSALPRGASPSVAR